ncbi:sulfite exporter TauE/SafE family protein [Silvimonas sp.]|uniref:sulfite exporter TauE/SafE family protein n=1 Tax=Silvimonas sp. TaxID=2650811 RepID=UPI00283B0733|nr:sulfite exporter TauE/SafE family protein [Silvimonas sp.]MDR3426861.1 sulfite exporter TauE/SafE family protein [Silvimonas sp.]
MGVGFVVSGLIVGFIVGVTGVGGGSLMTPILLFFGISPATAVGTDLLYASITKAGGVWVHHKHRNIDWKVTGLLAAGSVPASMLTLWALHSLKADTAAINGLIKHTLGVALLLTAAAILAKPLIQKLSANPAGFLKADSGQHLAATVTTGVVLGVIVTLSSIGAGALGTVALFLLYPLIPTSRLVGTEIAHAVPLTMIAGLGHAGLGNLDWSVLSFLLMGSLPGIYIGSHLSGRLPDRFLRPLLALMLALVGSKLVF